MIVHLYASPTLFKGGRAKESSAAAAHIQTSLFDCKSRPTAGLSPYPTHRASQPKGAAEMRVTGSAAEHLRTCGQHDLVSVLLMESKGEAA